MPSRAKFKVPVHFISIDDAENKVEQVEQQVNDAFKNAQEKLDQAIDK